MHTEGPYFVCLGLDSDIYTAEDFVCYRASTSRLRQVLAKEVWQHCTMCLYLWYYLCMML